MVSHDIHFGLSIWASPMLKFIFVVLIIWMIVAAEIGHRQIKKQKKSDGLAHCPDCDGTAFTLGPSGGLCTNVMCETCGNKYNYVHVFGTFERIPGVAEQLHKLSEELKVEIEPLQTGKTYRVNPAGSHTIDDGRGQPIQVDVTPYERPARRRAPDHDSMGPMK